MGYLEKHQSIRLAFRGTGRIRFKAYNKRNIPFFQRNNERGRRMSLQGHDIQKISLRQFRTQYLKKCGAAVGNGCNRPRLACRIVKNQGGSNIGRRQYRHRIPPRLQRYANSACSQAGWHWQQCALPLIRAFSILLNMLLIQRHHLAQTFLKQCLRILFGGRSSFPGLLILLRRYRSHFLRRQCLSRQSGSLRHQQHHRKKQCNNPFHGSSFHAHAVTVAKDATLFSQGTGSTL